MKSICFAVALFLGIFRISYAQENIATKLGYPPNSKLLIIHADDLGVSHSENMASIEAIEHGSVRSASVMMPTPWVLEAANYAKSNPDTHDFGLHLVLSSEWKYYKWGPVSSKDKVPSLVDKNGYFHEDCRTDLNLDEVEAELKAQVERAYAMGLEPTHLDSHMGCLFQIPELTETYLKIGQLYRLPVFVLNQVLTPELKDKYDIKVIVDNLYTISPEEYTNGSEAYYTDVIKNLKPGLSLFMIHTAYDNAEMKGMNIDHPDWGNAWRQKDFDFFTSKACKELLEKEHIKLITWRQLKDAFY
jgi:hypothetical protein